MPSVASAACYIDGFNLFHAIEALRRPNLHWTNLWTLAELLAPSKSQKIVRVVLCTAVRTDNTETLLRQRAFLKAQEASGVSIERGHFVAEDRICRACGSAWKAPVEKQGDVNVAIALIDDAHRDIFKHAYLVTADSDQAATVNLFLKRFPNKSLTVVSPPGRGHSKHILATGPLKISLDASHLEKCALPKIVMFKGAAIIRPKHYDPP